MIEQQSHVSRILDHLCRKGLYGDVSEWCEMRRDCVIVVTCPDCREQFTLDECEYDELLRLSEESDEGGRACGIRPLT